MRTCDCQQRRGSEASEICNAIQDGERNWNERGLGRTFHDGVADSDSHKATDDSSWPRRCGHDCVCALCGLGLRGTRVGEVVEERKGAADPLLRVVARVVRTD